MISKLPSFYNGNEIIHKCVIGLWYDIEGNDIVTFEQFTANVKSELGCYNGVKFEPRFMWDYLSTKGKNKLLRFDYCPYCGKKIDWKGLMETQGG